MDSDFEKQEKRIASVFPKEKKNIRVRKQTLKIYKALLDKKLTFPFETTGIDDFQWEEYYVLGPGDAKEYEKLKKTKPSYTDIFNVHAIEPIFADYVGLIVRVTRVSDKKRFKLPLADLKVIDRKSPNYQIVDDYSVWFGNY